MSSQENYPESLGSQDSFSSSSDGCYESSLLMIRVKTHLCLHH